MIVSSPGLGFSVHALHEYASTKMVWFNENRLVNPTSKSGEGEQGGLEKDIRVQFYGPTAA